MMSEIATPIPDELLQRMRDGSEAALAEVFSIYRQRLRRIIRFRLDHRLARRVSDSDVLQDTYLAAARRLEHFRKQPQMSPLLWFRLVAQQQLIDLHRQHLHAEMRDVRREVSIEQPAASLHTSLALAAQLVGQATAVSEIVARAERIQRLEQTLNRMDPMDREVIALRHFEELSNIETAAVLGIQHSAASKRYLRAMSRLTELLSEFAATDDRRESR
jgi:RNA polymerase sigma-70 factor (ECF subfamily)